MVSRTLGFLLEEETNILGRHETSSSLLHIIKTLHEVKFPLQFLEYYFLALELVLSIEYGVVYKLW